MANKTNLKTYPKVHLQHVDYGKGYAQVPNSVACNTGAWQDVSHKHFRIWVGLRSLRSGSYSKTEILRLLNLDRRNGLRDLKAMEDQGLIRTEGQSLVVIDPAAESQDENQQTEKVEEVKAEQPAIRETASPVRVVTPPAAKLPVIPAPSAAKPPAAKIIRHESSSALPLAASLAQTWNEANTKGYVRENVDAGGFRENTQEVIRHISRRYGVSMEEVVRRVVSGMAAGMSPPPVPSAIFTEANKDKLGGYFRNEIDALKKAKRAARPQKEMEVVKAAQEGLVRACERTESPMPPSLEELNVTLGEDNPREFFYSQFTSLLGFYTSEDQFVLMANKLGYTAFMVAHEEGLTLNNLNTLADHRCNHLLNGCKELQRQGVLERSA